MPQPPKRPTLATLAATVGVSAATASNAFNHPERLSAALRATILATAEKIGYAGPDPRAAALRRGRAGAVGVIVPDRLSYAFSDPAVVSVMDGFAEVLEEAAVSLLLLAGNAGRRAPGADRVQSAPVDGFVLYGGVEDPDISAALHRRRLPVIAMDGPAQRGRTMVDLDEEAGTRAMAEHLLGLGHRRFAVLTLPGSHDNVSGLMSTTRRADIAISTTRRRLTAALDALTAGGVPAAEVPVFELSHNHPDEAGDAARWLLSQAHRPTALICQSDQIAIGALDGARACGLRVPDDVSIGGFDDIAMARHTNPALTTVHQPLRERGRIVGQLLLRAMHGHRPRSVTLPTELVVRDSTARPPRSARRAVTYLPDPPSASAPCRAAGR